MRSGACLFEAKIFAEKRHYMVLKAIGYGTRMGSRVNVEAILEAVLVEHFVKLYRVDLETVIIAYVHGDAFVSF